MAVEGVPTTLVLDEDGLIHLTEHVDTDIYADENARKFGFVKVSAGLYSLVHQTFRIFTGVCTSY